MALSRIWSANLTYFEFPGGGYSLASLGLDDTLDALGLSPVPTPRHADVLFVSGPVTPKLEEPLGLVYAGMPRPRYAVAIGVGEDLPIPVDARTARDADDLEESVRALRRRIAGGYRGAAPLEEPAPGEHGYHEGHGDHISPHEGHGHAGDRHEHYAASEHANDDHGQHEGMDRGAHVHEDTGHGGHDMDMDHGGHSTPHGGHDMGGMDHSHMMGEMYESEDGLALETVEMPLGPVHPATPGGLGLTVTLDGDLVVETVLEEGYLGRDVAERAVRAAPEDALEALRWLDPRTPVSVPLLYCRALEDLVKIEVPVPVRLARIYLLELERVSSHLLWLSGFARVLGLELAARRALGVRRALLPALRAARAVPGGLAGELVETDLVRVRKGLGAARKALERGRLLPYRLEGLARIEDAGSATGPVARGAGVREDARLEDPDYVSLGFEPVVEEWGDALARYNARLREAEESLSLAGEAFVRAEAALIEVGSPPDGESVVVLEGPRGRASATLAAVGGRVEGFKLELPSRTNARLLPESVKGVSLSDAVAAVWSLDLSVEEMDG